MGEPTRRRDARARTRMLSWSSASWPSTVETASVYGSPRIHAELRLALTGSVSGASGSSDLMREARISGMVRRKRGRTTISVPGVRVADDLVERQFRPASPERALGRGRDLSSRPGRAGFISPPSRTPTAAADRRLVVWPSTCAQSSSSTRSRWPSARRRPDPGLIHHSDQGSQYVSLAFGQAARDAGIARSMGARATPTTTPSPRASSPPSRKSSSTADRGRPATSSLRGL